MKKASDLYSLTRRELILLEMFNMLDDEEQVQRLSEKTSAECSTRCRSQKRTGK